MELISLGCSLARWSLFASVMDAADYLGHGAVNLGIAAVTVGYGFLARDRRMKQAGFIALVAVIVAGLLASLLKSAFQMPRPDAGYETYGFPSGHASTAFAMAAALGRVFPTAAPFVFLLAVLASVPRLYFRDHFVTDVIGGGVLGTVAALLIARSVLDPAARERKWLRIRWGWAVPAGVGVLALAFFLAYERAVETHRVAGDRPLQKHSASTVITFGTLEARALLREGWSGDERWQGRFPMVWAEGLESKLLIPVLAPADHRVRLRVHPFVAHGGLSCQVVEVALNGVPAARFLVENGWKDYEIKVPRRLIAPGANEMRFRFAYADTPKRDALNRDGRALSVAFASLEAFVEDGTESLKAR
ncbi:MAG: phosphatase PAP2 family protein [Candidatus Rokubacteria bacterium]|nr:phosphatase PAP2 family protein [Candidatus Rokubacteria bacterium]